MNTFLHIREALLGVLCFGSIRSEKLDVLAVAVRTSNVL